MSKPSTQTVSHTSFSQLDDSPFDQLRDELLALDPRRLVPLNVDISVAALVVIGAASDIRKYRAQVVALVGEELARPIDRLELVARAAMQAQARHRAEASGTRLAPLATRVRERRMVLRAEVRSLVTRRLLAPEIDAEVTGGQGFNRTVFDVLQLVAALRQNWEAIEGRTGLTVRELDDAESDASQLASRAGIVEQRVPSEAAEMRLRAYSLMATTYDAVRRVISFLRWNEGDADRIAPAFLGTRRARRVRTEGTPGEATP